MRIAILETITTPGGHEADFDRILVDECKALGHEVALYIPEGIRLPFDYKVPVHQLAGTGISYTGVRGLKKIFMAAIREINRQSWYKQIYNKACNREFDAVIIPTSTYRYLRALNFNSLKKSPVPVIFIIHGVNPREADKFFREVERVQKHPNIKIVVLTFGDTVFERRFDNMICLNPPAYVPRDINYVPKRYKGGALRLGFFGQYRREKNLDAFLDTYLSGNYTTPVELVVQGATMRPEDTEDFARIIKKYSGYKQFTFIHKGLFGQDWQDAIAGIDALLLPYPAPRYRYHWAGMLFTAIGYQKPVVLSSDINPEVLQCYKLGRVFQSGDAHSLQAVLEEFINSFPEMADTYYQALEQASVAYAPRRFVERLTTICIKS